MSSVCQLGQRAMWQTRQLMKKARTTDSCIKYFENWVYICLGSDRKTMTEYQFFKHFGGINGFIICNEGGQIRFALDVNGFECIVIT